MANQYTPAEAERVFGWDSGEVREYYARLAEEQRDAVRQAVDALCGTPDNIEES